MAFYDYLSTSNGSGDAALMHITSDRATGNATIPVDVTTNVPAKFIGVSGTLGSDGFIQPGTARAFRGRLSGSNILIDGFLAGSTDNGNTSGQVVVIKPTTAWADSIASFIANATGYGTGEALFASSLTAQSLALSNNAVVGGSLTVNGGINGFTPNKLSNPYKFRVRRTATQDPGVILYDAKDFDTNSNFNTGNGRYVVPVSGFYQLNANSSQIINGQPQDPSISINVNGATEIAFAHYVNSYAGASNGSANASTLAQLTAGDYVSVNTGRPLDLGRNVFSGFLVSAT